MARDRFEELRRRLVNKRNTELGSDQFAFTDPALSVDKALPGFLSDRNVAPGLPLPSAQSRFATAEAAGTRKGVASALAAGAGEPVYRGSNPPPEPDVETPLEGGRAGVSGRIKLASGEVIERGAAPSGIPGYEDLRVAFERRTSPGGDTRERFLPSKKLNEPSKFAVAAREQIGAEDAGAKKEAVDKRLKSQRIVRLQGQLEVTQNPVDQQELAQQIRATRSGGKTAWQKTVEKWTAWDYTDFMATKNPAAVTSIQKANAVDIAKMGQLQAQFRSTPKSESFEIAQEIQALATKLEENVQQQSASLKQSEDLDIQQQQLRTVAIKESIETSGFNRWLGGERLVLSREQFQEGQEQFQNRMDYYAKRDAEIRKDIRTRMVLAAKISGDKHKAAKAKAAVDARSDFYSGLVDNLDKDIGSKQRSLESVRGTALDALTTMDALAASPEDEKYLKAQADADRLLGEKDPTNVSEKRRGGIASLLQAQLSSMRTLRRQFQSQESGQTEELDSIEEILANSELDKIERQINASLTSDSLATKPSPVTEKQWVSAWARKNRNDPNFEENLKAEFKKVFGKELE